MLKKTLHFANPAFISTHLEQLVIEKPDRTEPPRTVPIEDIGVVVLEHPQITLTHTALSKLMEANVAVITSDAKYHPNGLFLVLSGHTLQSQRFQAQVEASIPLKKQLWQQTVMAKINNQAALLGRNGQASERLLHLATEVKSGDTSNREALAAAYYWRYLFDIQCFENENFLRERFGDPPNNLLNYGYAILRAITARALVASGLLPTLGIHHHSKYNAYCLADDVMEPYRPFVDAKALEIWRDGHSEFSLTPSIKRALLTVATDDVRLDGQRSPLMIAVQRTAASLAKCFEGSTRKILYPEM